MNELNWIFLSNALKLIRCEISFGDDNIAMKNIDVLVRWIDKHHPKEQCPELYNTSDLTGYATGAKYHTGGKYDD